MLRIEVIANHSVEENILEAFAREGVGKYYTKFPNVFGVGSSGPRMGDAIWPEENFALVVWCEEDEARGIARAVTEVKERFPDEGIRIFGLPEQVAQPEQVSRFPGAPASAPGYAQPPAASSYAQPPAGSYAAPPAYPPPPPPPDYPPVAPGGWEPPR
jgi:hypothetical protein